MAKGLLLFTLFLQKFNNIGKDMLIFVNFNAALSPFLVSLCHNTHGIALNY